MTYNSLPMQEKLNLAVETGAISPQIAEGMQKLTPGVIVSHKNWGIGKVASWDVSTEKIVIDFENKKGFPMQFVNAVSALTVLSDDHIFARRINDPEGVRTQAASDPLVLVGSILKNFNGSTTAEQLSAALVPAVFDLPSFKKWWDAAKKKLKSDRHFILPSKKTDPITYHENEVSAVDQLTDQLKAARFPKDQVTIAEAIVREGSAFRDEPEKLAEVMAFLEDTAHRNRKFHTPQAITLLLAREDMEKAVGKKIETQTGSSIDQILRETRSSLPEIFLKLPAGKLRDVLNHFPAAFGEGEAWQGIALNLAKTGQGRTISEIANFFERSKCSEIFGSSLIKWVSDRSILTEMLIWLCRERGGDFPEVFNAELLNAIFSSLERDALDERRTTRLQDLLTDDRTLLADLLETASDDNVKSALKRLQLSPSFSDLDKRSLIARIIKLRPAMQSLVDDDNSQEDLSISVSWPSLTARKNDYENLINNLIPQNIRDIAVAREQGDLRENFGFKAAKEQQRVLARRRAEMARDLSLAHGTDFSNPDSSQASLGTTVTLDNEDGSQTIYSILGAWDSAPDMGIVSYKAAIGQALLGKKIGDAVELPGDGVKRRATLVTIVPFTDLAKIDEIFKKA